MNFLKPLLASALCVGFLIGCTAPSSLGRMAPYLGEYDTCEDIAKGMEVVNRFQDNASANTEYSRGKGVLAGALIGVNTERGDMMELQAAWKSGVIRRIGLDAAWREEDCPGAPPEYTGVPACTGSWASWNYDRGPGNKKACASFSRQERERYGITKER